MEDHSKTNESRNHLKKTDKYWDIKFAIHEDVDPALAHLTDYMNEEARARFRIKLQKYVRKPDRDLLLAVKGDRVLGLICMIDRMDIPLSRPAGQDEYLKDYAFISQLLVHPDQRKRGIGSSLHHRFVQWARERGRAGIWLITNHMAYWYIRDFGYDDIGRVDMKGVEKTALAQTF